MTDAERRAVEAAWVAVLLAGVSKVDAAVAAALAGWRGSWTDPGTPDVTGWSAAVTAEVVPVLSEVVIDAVSWSVQAADTADGAAAVVDDGLVGDLVADLAGVVASTGVQLAGRVDQAVTVAAQQVGSVAGEDYGRTLTAAIDGAFDWAKTAVRGQVRTAVERAASAAAHQVALAAAAAGPGVSKEWVTCGDDRVRPDHADADGQAVMVDQPFIVGGEELMYPGDPVGSAAQTAQCRCTVVYRQVIPADQHVSPAGAATESGGQPRSVVAGGMMLGMDTPAQALDDVRTRALTADGMTPAVAADVPPVPSVADGKITAHPDAGVAYDDEPAVDGDGKPLPARWHGVLVAEGIMSGDKRMIQPGALGVRPLPLALMYLPDTADWGHVGAVMCGQIQTAQRLDNGAIYATGTWDLGGDVGREAARCGRDQLVRFISIDMTDMEAEWVPTDIDYDDWGDPYVADEMMVVTSANIGKATQCTMPAFMQAVIAPLDMDLDVSNLADQPTGGPLGLVASGIPTVPPAEWFDDPELDRPTPLVVEDTGRVFGHICEWGRDHTSFAGQQVRPPHSITDYAFFKTGTVKAARDGADVMVRTGRLTMGTGHAEAAARHRQAAEHYDNTGTAWCDVVAGEDAHGVWVAGAVRPGVTEEQLRVARGSSPSGDWRNIGGNLELVAALMVNVPGFPVPALSLAAAGSPAVVAPSNPHGYVEDGEQLSLVAAGRLPARHDMAGQMARLAAQVAGHERLLAPQREAAARQAAARLRPGA